MESLHQRFGPHTEVKDLAELGIVDMPQYETYKDESQNADTFPALDKEPEVTPDWGNQYFNAEILCPRGNKMSGGQVVCHKHNVDGNLIGRSNQNTILDTHLYEVKFL